VQTRHLYSCPNVVTLMDRINQHVAAGVDALHPAVLRMIDLTCRGAARHGRPVGVCGGLASDPAAAALLVGLGVTELSCTPAAVHDVKAAIRQVDLAACRKLASAALELASPREVRDLVSASKK
jgi:phosphoenolpyruvate-protein kinase (PTS system EI component)